MRRAVERCSDVRSRGVRYTERRFPRAGSKLHSAVLAPWHGLGVPTLSAASWSVLELAEVVNTGVGLSMLCLDSENLRFVEFDSLRFELSYQVSYLASEGGILGDIVDLAFDPA